MFGASSCPHCEGLGVGVVDDLSAILGCLRSFGSRSLRRCFIVADNGESATLAVDGAGRSDGRSVHDLNVESRLVCHGSCALGLSSGSSTSSDRAGRSDGQERNESGGNRGGIHVCCLVESSD